MFHSIPLPRPQTPLLDQATTPDRLRQLPETALPALARELREYLLWCTGQTGGHFGAGLGVVELTIALHYVYNTPEDRQRHSQASRARHASAPTQPSAKRQQSSGQRASETPAQVRQSSAAPWDEAVKHRSLTRWPW